ncbi:MAG: hypothetical protein ACREUY_05025 [Burkholderiales bacterium]
MGGVDVTRRDPGPMARLEDVKRDADAPDDVFSRLCEGMSLFQIARAWGLPKHGFADWFLTEHGDLVDRAQRALASERMHEVVAIADDASGDVVRDKLRVETRFRVAAKFDRRRYGDEGDVVALTQVNINIADLRGAELPAAAAEPEK